MPLFISLGGNKIFKNHFMGVLIIESINLKHQTIGVNKVDKIPPPRGLLKESFLDTGYV